jgi:hypothetical protein
MRLRLKNAHKKDTKTRELPVISRQYVAPWGKMWVNLSSAQLKLSTGASDSGEAVQHLHWYNICNHNGF